MSQQAPETRLIELIVQTRLDTPSPDDVVELQSLLQDPRLRRLYLELMNVQGYLETVHTRQVEQAGDDRLTDVDSEDILLALRQAEEVAPVVPRPTFEWEAVPSAVKQQADTLTFRATVSAVSYLARTQVVKHRVMLGSVAAILVVGVVLGLTFLGGSDETQPTPNTAVTPVEQDGKPVVATLTEVNGAQWRDTAGSVTPRVGDQLHAGHELTLTKGFATITTKRGAIAIIEAPATIELIDHDNAIRLQHGKLLGICETPSSKGFLVRTPHMDITDLGTRFGVDASARGMTSVHVLEGRVEAALPGAKGGPAGRKTLSAGQAVRASWGDGRLISIEIEPERFTRAIPSQFLPSSTGMGLGLGDADPSWQLVAMNGQPVPDGLSIRVTDRPEAARDRPEDFESVPYQWLMLPESYTEQLARYDRVYTCRSMFELPAELDLSRADLVLSFQGGRAVSAVRVNGQPLKLPAEMMDRQSFYTPLEQQIINDYLIDGANTIEIELYDTDTTTTFRVGVELKPKSP